jgi:hypothetical protein
MGGRQIPDVDNVLAGACGAATVRVGSERRSRADGRRQQNGEPWSVLSFASSG